MWLKRMKHYFSGWRMKRASKKRIRSTIKKAKKTFVIAERTKGHRIIGSFQNWRREREARKLVNEQHALEPGNRRFSSLKDDIAGDLITSKAIPGFEKVREQAGKKLALLGADRKFSGIEASIMEGEIPWIPEDKRVRAVNYIMLKMAGIGLSREQIKALGLEKDCDALDKLIKMF